MWRTSPCLSGGRCGNGHQGDFVCLTGWIHTRGMQSDLCSPCPTNKARLMATAGSILSLCNNHAGWAPLAKNAALGWPATLSPYPSRFCLRTCKSSQFYELDLRWPHVVRSFAEDLGTLVELNFASLSVADPACGFKFENAAMTATSPEPCAVYAASSLSLHSALAPSVVLLDA